jgi:hypothetical protein
MLISTSFQDERAAPTRQLRREVFDGIRWLMGQGLLRIMWALNAAMAFVGGGFVLLLILLARQQHASPTAIGVMFSVLSAGVSWDLCWLPPSSGAIPLDRSSSGRDGASLLSCFY